MKIKIELTEPQCEILMDAINDHVLSLDAIANSDDRQTNKLRMLDRITQKLVNACRGEE